MILSVQADKTCGGLILIMSVQAGASRRGTRPSCAPGGDAPGLARRFSVYARGHLQASAGICRHLQASAGIAGMSPQPGSSAGPRGVWFVRGGYSEIPLRAFQNPVHLDADPNLQIRQIWAQGTLDLPISHTGLG